MGIKKKKKKKNEVETETWEESEKKMKVFLQGKLDLETEKIINKRVHRIVKKEEKKKRTIIANCLNYKQLDKVLNKDKELIV